MRRIVAPAWVGVLIVAGVCRAADPPAERGGRLSAEGFTRRTIYHSPQTPGYTCWVGAWAMPDGSLMTCFTQATGPLKGRPRASKEVRDKLGWPPASDPVGYDFTGLDLHNVYQSQAAHAGVSSRLRRKIVALAARQSRPLPLFPEPATSGSEAPDYKDSSGGG